MVGAGVAQFSGTLCEFTAVGNDDLMRIQQARQLCRNLLAALGWPRNPSQLGDVGRHRDTDSAQKLDSFRDRIDDLALFFVVLIEKKMELIERGSGHLPMGLLVEIPKSHGVGQQLIELLGHFRSEEHTSELQSPNHLLSPLLLQKKK